MGIFDELKRLTRSYEDEDEDDFEEFEPVERAVESRRERGGSRVERSEAGIYAAEQQQSGQHPHHHPAAGGAGQA